MESPEAEKVMSLAFVDNPDAVTWNLAIPPSVIEAVNGRIEMVLADSPDSTGESSSSKFTVTVLLEDATV